MTNPTLIATPFAENGDKNVIPESIGVEPQNATMQAGFPPITQQKISEGGIPPERNDFNGILNLYGQHIVHQNKGLSYEFDQSFADQIGGYPLGAELVLGDGVTKVISTIPNNTSNPNIDMDGWYNPIKDRQANVAFSGATPFDNDFDSAIDASPFISSYVNSFPDGTTVRIPYKYAIKSACVITKKVNFICDGELVVSGDASSVIDFKQDPSFTLTGSDLSKLPVKGDTKLFLSNTSLFNSSEYFFSIHSTEVEIVRIGQPTPYTKNETLAFIDSNFNIRGQFDLTYTDPSKITIYVYKRQRPTSINFNISFVPNVGQTTGARILEAHGVSDIDFSVQINRSDNVSGISFGYYDSAFFHFGSECDIRGGQSDAGDSYAFLNITSSYITHREVGYRDNGVTTKKERGYAARHGKYVEFDTCYLNGVDDHFGHHYIVKNSNFLHRGIGYCGGPLLVENCKQYSTSEPLVQLRTDTPYADGELIIRDCWAKANLLGASSANNASYNSKYKAWDSILIEDSSCDIDLSHAITIGTFYPQNTNYRTGRFEIGNFRYKRSATSTRFIVSSGGTEAFADEIIINGLDSIDGVNNNARFFFSMWAQDKISLNNVNCGIDGVWNAPKFDIINSKLGYAPSSSLTIIAAQNLTISLSNISNDAASYTSNATLSQVNLFSNQINTDKFTANSFISNAISCGYGNKVNVALGFFGDLRSYQKTKPFRYAEINYAIPLLNTGSTSPIQTSTILGARLGDSVEGTIVASSNGLVVRAFVSASDQVKWYIENPSSNPFGNYSGSTANIKLNVTGS